MWSHPRYHRWFAYLLVLNGVIYSLLPAFQLLLVAPKMTNVYSAFNTPPPSNYGLYILLVCSAAQLLFGIRLLTRPPGSAYPSGLLAVCILLLLFNLVFPAFIISFSLSSLLTPYYSL